MGGSTGMMEGLKAAGNDSPVYGNLTRLSSSGQIVPSGMAGGAPDPGYTNAPLHYTPQYTQISPTPFLQSVMGIQPAPQYNPMAGLQSLYSMFANPTQVQTGIQNLYGAGTQTAPRQPLPQYVGSTYRPDMSGALAKLRDVAPSVATEQAREAAAKAKWDAEHPAMPSGGNDNGGGGG